MEAQENTDAGAHSNSVVGDCALYENGIRVAVELDARQAGQRARTTDGFVWIGLRQPSETDIAEVAEEFGLPPLAVEDAVKAHQRPKLEVYGDVVFAVFKPVDYIDHVEIVDISEVAVFIGDGFLITVRHGSTQVVAKAREELDASDKFVDLGPSGVLHRIADLVVDGYERAIESINDDVDEIEGQVFDSNQADHVERIYKLKREIAQFRRAVVPLVNPMERLALGLVPRIDPDATPYFRDVHDHLQRAADAIEGHDRLLIDVLQADLAKVGIRQSEIAVQQNEDMRKISAWAAIALVPTAVAGIYGMNFDHMPELRWRYGYFLILGAIFAACFTLYRSFRKNGWL